MQEYFPKSKRSILKAPRMKTSDYSFSHQNLVVVCHDVFIAYEGGILLVTRDNEPDKGKLWPIGGRVWRGIEIEKSLKIKAKEECNLTITKIEELGVGRTLFATDPFGHNHGTDTFNVAYFAKSRGKLKLDELHKNPVLVNKKNYTAEFSKKLAPYVREFLEKALNKLA